MPIPDLSSDDEASVLTVFRAAFRASYGRTHDWQASDQEAQQRPFWLTKGVNLALMKPWRGVT